MTQTTNDISQEYIELLIQALTGSIYQESAWSLVQPTPFRRAKTPLDWLRYGMKNSLIWLLAKRSTVLLKTASYNKEAREEGTD